MSSSRKGSNATKRNGQLAGGNGGASGTSYAQRVAELRSALIDQVSEKDVCQIVGALVHKAKKGDTAAAREVFDRSIGRAQQVVLSEAASSGSNDEAGKPFDKVRLIRTCARLVVPKRAWPPGLLRTYESWREGRGSMAAPPDFPKLVELVETRCNWIRATPEAVAKWPNDVSVFDGEKLEIDRSKCPCIGDKEGDR